MGVIYYNDILYAGGGGGSAYGGTATPTPAIGADGDFYYQFNELSEVAISYVKLGGTWHKIAGGDVIIIEGGEDYFTDKIQNIIYAKVSEEDGLCKIGEVEEE